MIIELFDLMPMPDAWKVIVCLATLLFGPLFAAIWLKPTAARFSLGLLAILLVYVMDFILSTSIVISQHLAMDRFPMGIELILYGTIALGWVIGSVIGGLIHKDRDCPPRCDTTTNV